MSSMTWWDYVQAVSGGASLAVIAERIGVTPPSVGRWRTGLPDPARAAAFAKAYGRPVLEAFVVAGLISEEDAGPIPDLPMLTQFRDEDLIEEVLRRMKEGGHDGRQPEAEKMIMTDGGADGESEEGGGPTLSGQRKRGVAFHGRASRRPKDS